MEGEKKINCSLSDFILPELEFSVQDPSARKEKECVKILGKIISENLFNTNWRLQVSLVSYRLAYLTGRLKAHESDEDLLKLAMEIGKKVIG